jgi:hypothetical protein
MLSLRERLLPRLFVFALTVALFAIRALHVFALLIGTTRLSFALLIALLVRLLWVVGHKDTSSVARPCAKNALR